MRSSDAASARFGRERRLLTPSDYQSVFKARQRVGQSGLTFAWNQSPAKRARLGLAIAKKQVRRAHERNRIKRIAREAFRARAENLPAVDLVLMARMEVERMDNKTLRLTLDGMLSRVARRLRDQDGQGQDRS